MSKPPRRFPLPWTINGSESAYWLEDAGGKRFCFTYFDDNPLISTQTAGKLTRREALMIVRHMAKLPGLLRRG